MKSFFSQRLGAYLIDSFVIFVISFVISLFIPASSVYNNAVEESNTLSTSYLEKKITEEEYLERYGELAYVVDKERAIYNVVNVIITIAYFGAYPYYMKGQTIGKRIMKISISGNNSKNVSYLSFVGRSALIHGSIFTVINLFLLLLFNSGNYFKISSAVSSFYSIILIITVFMVIYRKDGRGIHDIIFKTKVIKN